MGIYWTGSSTAIVEGHVDMVQDWKTQARFIGEDALLTPYPSRHGWR
ncbi:MAG: hypothetical protein ABW096_17995 [Candidatus Thiodiazotropha sp.]